MIEQINKTIDLKLYSKRAIGVATFIGGPLAAGYLIRENFVSLDRQEDAKKALIIGITTTILLFTVIFLIPDNVIEKIPTQVIPLLYTGLTYWIVEQTHGTILNEHKEYNNEFQSVWKAVGAGIVALIILFMGIFTCAYFATDNDVYDYYDQEIAKFVENEKETMIFYEHISTKNEFALIKELDNTVLPKWEENIDIIHKINQTENLPEDLKKQNTHLLNYAELRIKAFQLFRKAISEDSETYADELEQIHIEIDKELKNLN